MSALREDQLYSNGTAVSTSVSSGSAISVSQLNSILKKVEISKKQS